MKTLLFDTTNQMTYVLIANGKKVLSYLENRNNHSQAETIIPMLNQSLKNSSLRYSDLDQLVIINGPGSFTGIRIGIAVLKALVLATNLAVKTISNFDIAFFRAKKQIKYYDRVYVLLNSGHGFLYTQIFDTRGVSSESFLLSYNDIIDLINNGPGLNVCIGEGVDNIYEFIKNKNNVIVLPRSNQTKWYYLTEYLISDIKIDNLDQIIEPLYIKKMS